MESSRWPWNRIARTVAVAGLDLWESARLFGLLNLAMADGYVARSRRSTTYNFWRPVTAIREAGTDGNPARRPTRPGPRLVTTPPIPDHDSGTASREARPPQVLKRFFGTDQIASRRAA